MKEAKINASLFSDMGTHIQVEGNLINVGVLLSMIIAEIAKKDEMIVFSAIDTGLEKCEKKGVFEKFIRLMELKKGLDLL